MKATIEVLLQWLDLKSPNWFALIAASLLGIMGVVSLSFLVVLFAPGGLVLVMPVIVVFSALSGGYKFWEKRQKGDRPRVHLLYIVTGLITSGLGTVIQYNLDSLFFNSQTSVTAILIIVICGPVGAFLGFSLRRKYEKIEHIGTKKR